MEYNAEILLCQLTGVANTSYRSSHPRCSMKKGVLGNLVKFTGRHATLFKKASLAQVFSSEFCKISKSIFTEHLWVTVSDLKICNFVIPLFHSDTEGLFSCQKASILYKHSKNSYFSLVLFFFFFVNEKYTQRKLWLKYIT